jgi:hypothetical protein
MFGVFNGYEKQLVKDWISGAWQENDAGDQPFRARFRRRPAAQPAAAPIQAPAPSSLAELVDLISPAKHHTPDGLNATKTYSSRFAQGLLR